MKAFFIGLVVLIAASLIAVSGFLLLPFFLMLGVALRIFFGIIVAIFAIWLLGKTVILLWESLRSRPHSDENGT